MNKEFLPISRFILINLVFNNIFVDNSGECPQNACKGKRGAFPSVHERKKNIFMRGGSLEHRLIVYVLFQKGQPE
jgi:hypothetical protein